jgi:hypothetical protein
MNCCSSGKNSSKIPKDVVVAAVILGVNVVENWFCVK